MCATGFYRPDAHSSVDDCMLCSTIHGVTCGMDATIMTLNVSAGHWRHSMATLQTHDCKSSGSWSPCRGGIDAGDDGDGYCAAGYAGPRCEVCIGSESSLWYFDKLEARCNDCGNLHTKTLVFGSVLLVLLTAGFGGSTFLRLSKSSVRDTLLRFVRGVQSIWRTAGMRYKVKMAVGFYQCIAAVPSIFDVEPPAGLEAYSRWIYLIELPSEFEAFLVPPACLGSFRARLWAGSLWPIGALFGIATGLICWEALLVCVDRTASEQRRFRSVIIAGLQRALPVGLGLTFLVLPSASTRIFKTFRCEPIEYSVGQVRRYVYAAPELECDSEDYSLARRDAIAFLFLWPVGCPVLYAVLLWTSRKALAKGVETRLSRATSFLSGDYKKFAYWWEPLEMCRKLLLCGWVMVIVGEGSEQGRVLMCLLITIVFLTIRLSFKPLLR